MYLSGGLFRRIPCGKRIRSRKTLFAAKEITVLENSKIQNIPFCGMMKNIKIDFKGVSGGEKREKI
ncbi:hypothetical protein [Priestia koreensis]|uniref:Uncharacterized protein n=1 Tax=Priestia koreensis TaxID=284581 RepID=A0A0M0LA53_9BACI|nr:hypothetical protein [Priestia koreensis]KOO47513.1 hypothetical protein AMD01_05575 [Priestia koreensis]